MTISLGVFTMFTASAQDNFEPLKDRQLYFDIINIVSIVWIIYLISTSILQLVKNYLTHKLKSRIIDRQTPENIVQQLVTEEKKDRGQVLMQWFCVLGSIAIGLLIVRATLPLGLHSLAILAACLAGGCAAAFYASKKISSNAKDA